MVVARIFFTPSSASELTSSVSLNCSWLSVAFGVAASFNVGDLDDDPSLSATSSAC